MLKKITFNLILFSFLYYEKALASDEGMPQLNPEFWISQIFWLTIIFGSLYILLSKLILPKISNNLEIRKSQIAENIEAAEKQRNESDQKLKDYEKIINNAKIEAKNIFNQAREKILRDINNKKKGLEKKIDEEIDKAEKEILDFKKKSPEKINKIAIETSADLIKQIIGAEVNNSNISAIVEDISKKNEVKYYDN
ncbi:MAG TPA: F0F1 ATP synthase subunit B [Candidatus Pelagibacter bacterium]|jgi:F-type H+-transporting ATPase subunit b|nr:F0F1 ATP synthase subunit B [Pelagibacteraceae bacterium]HJN84067.1 F0F1 ATP synthase subunit B [Candidatus Pelagibacter bacterium]|tara:strand:+ start:90 stop:677 length:588 start_codon:yes stop_codon:yes gene_type:complete